MTLQEQAASPAVLGAEEEAVIRLLSKIIDAAIADRASDIHIDPSRRETKVRFRIDGVMQEVVSLPKNVHAALIARFKIMGDLDVAERRTIQDGHIRIQHEGKEFDLRMTIMPAVRGEKLAARLIAQAGDAIGLENVGYREPDMKRLEKCMHSPCGLMIFSGPTGCGKVTIMTSVVKQLMHPQINVMTVEDPVTFVLPGATQVMVNRKVGLTEAQAIRGFLRADPDIIMIGNMPNLETAELAVQAAITGHLVLAPLHADDAPQAVKRLFDMGVEPFLLSHCLLMVQSQRLARKICSNCKQKADYPEKFMTDLRKRAEAGGLVWPDKAPTFFKGKGCDHCRNTGYSGRIGIFEILTMEKKEMRELIAERASVEEIRKMAIADGMTTMLADGIYKALEGKTTIEEVVRVTYTADW